MPEVFIDKSKWKLHKQVELRSPSERGYYFDVCWILADFARVGKTLRTHREGIWTVHEVYGSKPMPNGREDEEVDMVIESVAICNCFYRGDGTNSYCRC